ncbi:MAG: hypothetical protein HC806_02525 [Anaerolineae bacterium]|nr:hypothetical protein [Anaerolineae bacterium]
MLDYEPLSLSSWCNAGFEMYEKKRYTSAGTYLEPRPDKPPVGEQIFHGLPFQIGSKESSTESLFIGFGDQQPLERLPVTIPVGKTPHYVIFAHAVLETNLWTGGPLGEVIAHYIFHYQSVDPVVVPIRERFEIGNVPVPWGQYPFLCFPDQIDHLEDRHKGQWERAGFRLTEVGWAVPHGYYLWPWHNPNPNKILEAIEIVPKKQTFVIAGITLSFLMNPPLCEPRAVRLR